MVKKSRKNGLIPELSVFFPAWNEEKNLQSTVEKAIRVIERVASKWEVLIINDGSTDETGKVAEKIKKKYPKNVRVLTHKVNLGYGPALKNGFYSSRYQWIAFTDADGQFDFEDIYKLIEKQEKTGADLVIGYYLDRKVSFVRILGSKIWELAVFLLFSLKVKDIDCGFKLIKKEVVDTIPRLESQRGPFISSEFLIKAKKSGFKIAEVGVQHYPRKAGQASGTDLNVILSGLKDLIRLWWKLNFKKK